MPFHEYLSLRNRIAKFGTTDSARKFAKSRSPDDFRKFVAQQAMGRLGRLEHDRRAAVSNTAHFQITQAFAEKSWVESDRPFYNVWPVAQQLAENVKLEVPFSAVETPFESILLRFARGHEPNTVTTATTAMLFWPKNWPDMRDSVHVVSQFTAPMTGMAIRYDYKPDTMVENWLQSIAKDSNVESCQSAAVLMVRLVVFIGLLANDHDMITPVVLSRDQAKYDSTDDEDVKKWLEDRAARRAGRGFDVGKKLQLEKDSSPRWRNPHLALFWTGTGRTIPIIKMRSGAIIRRVEMADVPTGYLGPETDEEANYTETTPRESISKARRFEIFKRDDYRCQICGKHQGESVTLHVDHKIPLAKGGSNEDDNLWTLCESCNLGKSDAVL